MPPIHSLTGQGSHSQPSYVCPDQKLNPKLFGLWDMVQPTEPLGHGKWPLLMTKHGHLIRDNQIRSTFSSKVSQKHLSTVSASGRECSFHLSHLSWLTVRQKLCSFPELSDLVPLANVSNSNVASVYTSSQTVKFLKSCHLEVGMKNNVKWELNPEAVASCFPKNL